MKKLETMAVEAFRICEKRELYYLPYCLFSNIFIQMNHIEIYYLCSNYSKEDKCCLDEGINYCKQCKRLNEFNLIYSKISTEKTFRLLFLVDKLIDILFVYKYHLLSGLKRRNCKLDHKSILNHLDIVT